MQQVEAYNNIFRRKFTQAFDLCMAFKCFCYHLLSH